MGSYEQMGNYMQSMNESAMLIKGLEDQGYKQGTLKDFQFNSVLNEQEIETVSKFNKTSTKSAGLLVGIAVTMIIFCVIFMLFVHSSNHEEEVMKYIASGIIITISVIVIVVFLVRILGAKSAAHAIVVAKYSRISRTKNGTRYYMIIAYQSYPNKVYAKGIRVTRKTFDEIKNCDSITIIKSPVGSTAFIDN